MRLEQHNGVHLILEDSGELFWTKLVANPGRKTNRPTLKPVLKDWWDNMAPGQWTTSYVDYDERRCRAILIEDPKMFSLFKLAFQGTSDISGGIRIIEADKAYVYAPYVPLLIGRQV